MRWTEGYLAEAVEAATSPGSERVACVRVGFPGTREASSSPITKPEAVDAAPGVRRSEAAGMVPPGEGNEARGDGRRGVGVSHSTAEAGELSPRRGGKGAPAGGTGGGKDGQHTEIGSRLHVTTTDSRTGQISLGDGGGHRLAPAGTRRRVAKPSVEEPDAAEPARPDLWGGRVHDPGLPDRIGPRYVVHMT